MDKVDSQYMPQSPVISLNVETSGRSRTQPKFISTPVKRFVPRKAIVKRTHILQKIFKTRNQPRSQYYTSEAPHVDSTNQRDVTTEISPFKYPLDSDLFAYKGAIRAWEEKQRSVANLLPVHLKPSFKTKQNYDLLKRTFVPEVKTVIETITDIDPSWFNVVEGRPILTKHSQSGYVQDLRNCLLTKLSTALNEDEILRLEENYRRELSIINNLNKKFKQCVSSFEDMLSKDSAEAMTMLRLADKMLKETAIKDENYKNLSRELGITKVRIYVLEEQWRNLKIYQKFLYQISPMYWRRENDYIHRDRDGGLVTHWTSLFGKYRLSETDSIASLDSLIGIFLDDIDTQQEPKLYFTKPIQVVKVFRELETQNLNSLLHSEDLATPLENMTVTLKETQERLDQEYKSMQEIIEDIEKNIKWYEARSSKLETDTRDMINETFKALVAGNEAIELFVHVEDLYETLIAPNDANLGIRQMMVAVENKYEKFMLELDTITLEAVKSAEGEAYAEEFRIMKQAKDAQRKVQLIDILTHKLRRVLEPPIYRTTKELKPRSPLPERRKVYTAYTDDVQLDENEKEYAEFFTEFCATDAVSKDTKRKAKK